MEPSQIAVEVIGDDAAPPAQGGLDLAVAAVDRLDVRSAPGPLASRGVDALVRDVGKLPTNRAGPDARRKSTRQDAQRSAVSAHGTRSSQSTPRPDGTFTDVERRRNGRIAAVGVGDEQRIRRDDRLQHLLHALCVQRRQGMAEGLARTVGGDQDRHLLAREAAFAGLPTAPARLPLPLAALQKEGLVRLDDPGKPIWRLANRRQKEVAPAMLRARRNPAALCSLFDRLAFGKRGAKGKPALLMMQTRQRCPREGTWLPTNRSQTCGSGRRSTNRRRRNLKRTCELAQRRKS